jgi:predicted DNA-binding transcriptional regulator AlpA
MKSYSVKEWAALHGFTREHFYTLKERGQAPRFYKVGTIVRITEEANREWIATREAETAQAA